MTDHGLLLDLKCPARAAWFYVFTTGPAIALVLTFFIAGWNDTPQATVILIVLGICFSLPGAQSIQERVQVSQWKVRTRYLGFWRERDLPQTASFRRSQVRRRYDGIAQMLLKAPEGIEIINIENGRVITEIGSDLLAGMRHAEYSKLLHSLNKAIKTRSRSEQGSAS